MGYFDEFDTNLPICIDVETISWDDKVAALQPYHGHRVSTVVVGQRTADGSILVKSYPVRHRTERDLLPFDKFFAELAEWAKTVDVLFNTGIKFDIHCLWHDGVTFDDATLEPLEVLGRIVNNQLMDYKHETMCQVWCPDECKESEELKAWLLENATLDYGAVPHRILLPYAEQDVRSAIVLRERLLGELKSISLPCWETEKQFCPILINSENSGVLLDMEYFKFRRGRLLLYQDDLQCRLNRVVKETTNGSMDGLNPRSSMQLGAYFKSQGIESPGRTKPTANNPKGNPSWDAKTLAELQLTHDHPALDIIGSLKGAGIAIGTFCEGWTKRVDGQGILHPNFKSHGTGTGRISSSDPNLQNPPKWAMDGIRIPDGYVGIKLDYSQIEYRIFAHYSGDQDLIKIYQDNPRIDFHQQLADRLGIERDPTKTLNFGILYGMGKKKLRKSLIKELRKAADPSKLAKYGSSPEEMADAVLEEYHRLVPGVRRLNAEVKETLRIRGWIRNFFGRIYHFDLDKAYIAVNYLCQGSAADMFKNRCVELFTQIANQRAPIQLVTNIHDSILAMMPEEWAEWYWSLASEVMVAPLGFKIPILIDGDIYTANWGRHRAVPLNYASVVSPKEPRMLKRTKIECSFAECLDKAKHRHNEYVEEDEDEYYNGLLATASGVA